MYRATSNQVKATTADTKAAKKQLHRLQRPLPAIPDDNIQVTLTEKTVEKYPGLHRRYHSQLTTSKTAFAKHLRNQRDCLRPVTAANNSAILAVNGVTITRLTVQDTSSEVIGLPLPFGKDSETVTWPWILQNYLRR